MKNDTNKLVKEVESFDKLWIGGFCRSKFGWDYMIQKEEFGHNNEYGPTLIHSKLKERHIDPYLSEETIALEIGTDGGFFAAIMHKAKKIIGMDIRPAEHTLFWENLVRWNITPKECITKYEYVLNRDFSCSALDDNSIDYVFSFDVFCHISYSGQEQYLRNLYNKLKPGANLFIMIADGEEYDNEVMRQQTLGSAKRNGVIYNNFQEALDDYDGDPYPGRWYWVGKQRFIGLLDKYGYELIDSNCCKDIVKFSPVLHFRKPK